MDVYDYREIFSDLLCDIGTHIKTKGDVPFGRAVDEAVSIIKNLGNGFVGKMIWVGNGGSAGIASHQAVDFLKTAGIPNYVPSDFSLLTCMGNDYGYEKIFSEPILVNANPGDLLVAISSSGKSLNILNAVKAARERSCHIITLSGFEPDNPLRLLGDVNFYVPSYNYRYVESAHLFISNCILERVLGTIDSK